MDPPTRTSNLAHKYNGWVCHFEGRQQQFRTRVKLGVNCTLRLMLTADKLTAGDSIENILENISWYDSGSYATYTIVFEMYITNA